MLLAKGWQAGNVSGLGRERALFPQAIIAFIARYPAAAVGGRCAACTAARLETMLLTTLVKELDIKGIAACAAPRLQVLRQDLPAGLLQARPRPERRGAGAVRQEPAHGHPAGALPSGRATTPSICCFAVNGLPVATCELKNPGTGQSWRNAVRQYQEDRDPRAPLFEFKTAGAGPLRRRPRRGAHDHPAGRRQDHLPALQSRQPSRARCSAARATRSTRPATARGYFWEEVLQRDSFLDILGHFMFIEKKEEKVDDGKGGQRRITRETMIFPRYHQLDAVRKIVAAARGEGPGQQLPDPALGRQRQDQQHLLALAPAGEPAR